MENYKAVKRNGRKQDEHRLVMEEHLGRKLKPQEVVHHIDGDKSNNKLSNLALFPTKSAHTKYHHENGDYRLVSGRNKKKLIDGMLRCSSCNQLKLLDDFIRDKNSHLGVRGTCKECYKLHRKR